MSVSYTHLGEGVPAAWRSAFFEFMKQENETIVPAREAVLVAVIRDQQQERQAVEYLDELEFLAETAGIASVKRFTQRLANPSSKTFVGEGKLAEIAAYVEEHEIAYVIFDDELTPSQLLSLIHIFRQFFMPSAPGGFAACSSSRRSCRIVFFSTGCT